MTTWRRVAMAAATVATAVLAWALAPRRADACSFPRNGVENRSIFPADGAVDVPRNVRIRLGYVGEGLPPPEARLRLAGGDDVPVELRSIRDVHFLVPTVPLAPSTAYELTDRLVVPCAADGSDWTPCLVEERAIVSFTTGTGTDEDAPVFDGLATLDSSYFEDELEGCDQSIAAVRIELRWDAAVDDGAADGVSYNIYDAGVLVANVRTPSSSALAACGGVPSVYPFGRPDFWGGHGPYVVRAVDAAGNEDANDVGATTVDCGEGGGCASSERTASLGLALLVLLAAANARVPRRCPR